MANILKQRWDNAYQGAKKSTGQLAKGDLKGAAKTTWDAGTKWATDMLPQKKDTAGKKPEYAPPAIQALENYTPQMVQASAIPTAGWWNSQQVSGAPGTMQGGQIGGPTAAPTAAAMRLGQAAPQDFFGAQQAGLINQLGAKAAGNGPFMADMAAQQARQANQAALFSSLASQRGGANPLAARLAAQQNSLQMAQTNRDAMMARMQEQQQAQGMLGQVAGQARGQEMGMAQQNAQFQQEAALAHYKGQLDRAVQQGQLDQRTAEAMFAEANQNARYNSTIDAQSQDRALRAYTANQDANLRGQIANQGALGSAFQTNSANNTWYQGQQQNAYGQQFSQDQQAWQAKVAADQAAYAAKWAPVKMGAQAVGTFYGGPVGGMAAGGAVDAYTGNATAGGGFSPEMMSAYGQANQPGASDGRVDYTNQSAPRPTDAPYAGGQPAANYSKPSGSGFTPYQAPSTRPAYKPPGT